MGRLDVFVKNEFCYSREYAKEIILKGYVFVNNNVVYKPSFEITQTDIITLDEKAKPKYVSRGGIKLEKAITDFSINIKDKVCLDIGASTGGFTDCMLKNGAKYIVAVDVGEAQLNESLKLNTKVKFFENTDIRNFTFENEKFDFISSDVSFISILKILFKVKELLKDDGSAVLLIKPQFEVGAKNVKKGIVKDKKLHIKLLEHMHNEFIQNDFYIENICNSPIKGGKGNIEYLVHLKNANALKCSVNNFDYKNIVYNAFSSLD